MYPHINIVHNITNKIHMKTRNRKSISAQLRGYRECIGSHIRKALQVGQTDQGPGCNFVTLLPLPSSHCWHYLWGDSEKAVDSAMQGRPSLHGFLFFKWLQQTCQPVLHMHWVTCHFWTHYFIQEWLVTIDRNSYANHCQSNRRQIKLMWELE